MSIAQVAGVDVDTRHWIGGERVASAADLRRRLSDRRPGDRRGEPRRPAEVDAAVAAAARGLPRAGPPLPRAERAAILRRVADGVEKRVEDLAQVETRDNGSLLRSHRRGVMPRVAMNFRFFADHLLEPRRTRTSRPAVTATTSPGTRPASPRSSRRGTRRSCSPPGGSGRRSPPGTPSSPSRRSGRR